MKSKFFLTIIATTVGFIAMAQNDLKLKLDSIANSGMEKGIPGIQILISDNDSLSIFNYGFQDINKANEINDSTNWRYGSITKLFTAVIILQLESEGMLSINDLVSNYLDLNRYNESGISIKQLLNHTSGLYDYVKKVFPKHKWESTPEQCVQYSLDRKKQNFAAGSKFEYCNTGFAMLGLIIEKVTDKSFAQNLNERIFEPCNLISLDYSVDEKVPKNTAKGYEMKKGKYVDYTNIDHKWANSAGAILGTSHDLYQFNKCLFEGKLLDSTQLNKMINSTIVFRDLDAEGLEWFYHAIGLGWHLSLDLSGKTTNVSHNGNTAGYNCNIQYQINNNLTIVIAMNLFPSGKYEPVFSTQNQLINTIHEYYKRKK